MGALKLPGRMTYNGKVNQPLCARIGVRLNGKDLGYSCVSYDVAAGTVKLNTGEQKTGTVEPYWR